MFFQKNIVVGNTSPNINFDPGFEINAARIFGGASMLQYGSSNDTGKITANFLQKHLESEQMKLVAGSMGGSYR